MAVRLVKVRAQIQDSVKDMNEPISNPLTISGKKVMKSMIKEYGKKKGKGVFYASINAKKKGSKKWHE